MDKTTFKLYAPLTADRLPCENMFPREDDFCHLYGPDLTDYAAEISERLEQEDVDLARYLDTECRSGLATKVKSIRISVEDCSGELLSCATVVTTKELTERDWDSLRDYVAGHYIDGWGEGFEQFGIQVEDGVLFIHFWQPQRFAFTMVPTYNTGREGM